MDAGAALADIFQTVGGTGGPPAGGMAVGTELKSVGGPTHAAAGQAANASVSVPAPVPTPAPATAASTADEDPLARLLRTLAAVATTPSVDQFGATLAMTGPVTSLPEAMAVMNFLLPASPAKIVATVNGLPAAQRQQLADDVAALAADANAALPRITIQTALLQWLGRTLGAGLPEAASRELGTTLNHLHILGGMTQPAAGAGGAAGASASSAPTTGSVPVGWKVGIAVLCVIVVVMVAVIIWLALRHSSGPGTSVGAGGRGRGAAPLYTAYGQGSVRGGPYDTGMYLDSSLGASGHGAHLAPAGGGGGGGGGNHDLSPFPMGSLGSLGSPGAMGRAAGVQYDRPFDLRSPGPGMYGGYGPRAAAPSFPPLAHQHHHG